MTPWFSQEFDLLFQQVYQSGARVITLAGASRACGTSTLSRWLAQRLSGEHARVLLIDFDFSGSGQGLPAADWSLDGTGQAAALHQLNSHLAILPQPSSPVTRNSLRQPGLLSQAIATWKAQYDFVLCDAGTVYAANWQNLSAPAIGAVSDGALLCAAAATTPENNLLHSVRRLEQGKVVLIGTIINDMHYPNLACEITRVLNKRGRWLPQRIRQWLIQRIRCSPLLQGEYQL
ncbi:hypothetical protein [Photobacterium atrarenae]|uniref:Chromosome partitioning protein ParA n=1 Tax=Photobacterium atrarenae TaxID=865757 RepID=A0ABY5GD74_9GAMM|nr:hypothetical protein [Photobacterium atrarenae]UTV26740.1 hypothetical protein NNL38_10265 [Photobacterium atrarenae]